MYTFETNRFLIKRKRKTKQPCKNVTQRICDTGRVVIYNLDTSCILVLDSTDTGIKIRTKTPCVASHHCGKIICSVSLRPAQDKHCWA